MLSTIRAYFAFGGANAAKLRRGMAWAVANSLFEALQILALSIVLSAVARRELSSSTAVSSLLVMLVSIAGSFVTAHFKSQNFCDGNYSMCGEKRAAIGDHLRLLPMGYFNETSLGEMASTMTSTLDDVQNAGGIVYTNVISGLVLTLIMSLALGVMDPRCGLLALATLAGVLGVMAVMQRVSRATSRRRVEAQQGLVGAVLEYVQGMSVVRAFSVAKRAESRLGAAIRSCEAVNLGLELRFIGFMVLEAAICKAASVGLCLLSVHLWVSGSLETGTCLTMLVASFLVFAKLELVGSYASLLRMIDLSMDKVNALIATPPMDEGAGVESSEGFDIRLEDVSFSYGGRRVVDRVSLDIPQGSSCALVGPSGAGKTTLAHLMVRFWDVSAGRVLVGGHDVRDWKVDALLSNFSMVFQGVYLFDDTVENNIKFGRPEASHEEVVEAARRACCDTFIESLPQGYETRVGEGGAALSGGERQRLSIARAILKDAPVVILDEATANVDPENELELQRAVEELRRGKTVIMIAHRLKTVRTVDQIAVIDAGRIVQRGTHDELMRSGGIYRDFVGMRERAIGWRLARS
ncbi:ABC transporter ATP-binding protein [Olsenella massiliensis]|uniref:ABC transporter ATP-binding protein n=1 Tax=Olsenella massiliensis TaxID=1622075 RepID=UPI00071C46CD|nr:ABC transporter ATP-binding protein [Olsenella massiliensis]